MIAGGTLAGGSPLLGRITGPLVGPDGIEWSHDVHSFDGTYALAIDGEVVSRLPAGTTSAGLPQLDDGEHSILLEPVPGHVISMRDYHGDPRGRRPYIMWPVSEAADLVGYLVFGDGGTGTMDWDDPVATVEDVVVGVVTRTGTGTGRIEVQGDWTGSTVNATFEIEVTSDGWRHNVSGPWSEARPVVGGRGFALANGLRFSFLDAAPAYEAGDSFEFRVGPKCSWLGPELADGTYKFGVRGFDAAGNVGTETDTTTVVIAGLPPAVEDLAASWDGLDGSSVSLSWARPMEFDSIRIYSNFSLDFGTLAEGVIFDGPWATIDGDDDGHEFTPSVAGLWKFVIRGEVDGLESGDSAFLQVDLGALPDGARISEPFDLQGYPAAGGKARLTWKYVATEDDDLAGFAIYVGDDPETLFDDAPYDSIEATKGGEPVAAFEWVSHVLVGNTWFGVRAVDSEALSSRTTDAVLVVPDAAGPAMAGGPSAVPA